MKVLLFIVMVVSGLMGDVAVVVSKNSKISEVQKEDIERLFLSKSTTLANLKAQPLEGRDEATREVFYKSICNKSLSQLRSYWAKQLFTGKAKPPMQVDDAKIVGELAKEGGAISYIPSGKVDDSLKVLLKVE